MEFSLLEKCRASQRLMGTKTGWPRILDRLILICMVKVKCCVGCQRKCKSLRMTWINRKVGTGTGQPVVHSDSCPQWLKWSGSSFLDSAPNVDTLGRLTGNSETYVFMLQSSLLRFMTGVGVEISNMKHRPGEWMLTENNCTFCYS